MSESQFHPVTHVIFDMDGLLIDTEPRYEWTYATMCKRYGTEYTFEAKQRVMGRNAWEGAKALIDYLKLPLTVEQFVEEIEQMYEEAFTEYIPFFPGVERLVKHLKQHDIPFCIATSGRNFAFKLKEKHHPDFFPLFHHIVKGSDDAEVKNGKPAPDIFLVAASRFDKPPTDMKNVLVFEDSTNGVRAGLAAGMQVVWVPHPTTDTSQVKATLVLKSLEQFKPELFSLPPFKDGN